MKIQRFEDAGSVSADGRSGGRFTVSVFMSIVLYRRFATV